MCRLKIFYTTIDIYSYPVLTFKFNKHKLGMVPIIAADLYNCIE